MFRCASHTASVRSRALARVSIAALFALSFVLGGGRIQAQPAIMPAELEGVDVNEHLDQKLPLDARFKDHTGKERRLAEFFDGQHPVALTLAYHGCKVVCSMVLGAEVQALRDQPWTLGKEFRAVTISIDSRDTPADAAKKRSQMLKLYGRDKLGRRERPLDGDQGWDFLVGDDANIKRVADAVGFKFRYDQRNDQFAHPAALMLVKPNGEMARYLYGLEFPVQDVRIGLLEASQGRSVSTIEKAILYCYMYDPIGAKYVLVAKNVMRLGGVLTMLVLGSFLTVMWMREARAKRRSNQVATVEARGSAREQDEARDSTREQDVQDSRGTSRARPTRVREV